MKMKTGRASWGVDVRVERMYYSMRLWVSGWMWIWAKCAHYNGYKYS